MTGDDRREVTRIVKEHYRDKHLGPFLGLMVLVLFGPSIAVGSVLVWGNIMCSSGLIRPCAVQPVELLLPVRQVP